MQEAIQLKPNPQWRQYKFELEQGYFLIIKDTIREPEQLQAWIDELKPKNVYETTSTWADPDSIRGDKISSYAWNKRALIDNLILIDIDSLDVSEVKKTLKFFQNRPRFKLWKVVCSGGGYHVYYHDLDSPNSNNPLERINLIKEDRLKLAEELTAAGIVFDVPVLTDIYRVSRVIGTWNGNKNQPCREVSVEELQDQETEDTTKINIKQTKPQQPATPSALYFVSNKIPGVKDRYVPVLFLYKKNYKKVLANQSLNLGRVYVVDLGNVVMAVSLKSVSSERITKILHKANAINQTSWHKYKHSWIHLITIPDLSNTDLRKRSQLSEVIDNGPITYFASRPHLDVLSKVFNEELSPDYPLKHGSSRIRENLVIRGNNGTM